MTTKFLQDLCKMNRYEIQQTLLKNSRPMKKITVMLFIKRRTKNDKTNG